MRKLIAAACALPLLACTPAPTQANSGQSDSAETGGDVADVGAMEVSRASVRPPSGGSGDRFTGNVTITPLFDPKGSSQVGAALVRFEPGARTAWHKHPLGQRLVLLQGTGWTQVEGGPIEAIRAGDVVWCPPDVRHWHGATPTSAMAHIAIQEAENGSPVEWMEHVPDELYRSGPA
ncbi:MAG TPA: cupin domain-containing protein [Allosphingosinicella sp.]